MWKCPRCREESDDDFEKCWSCGADRNEAPSAAPPSTPSPLPDVARKDHAAGGGKFALYATRYADAYRIASLLVTASNLVKFIGFAIGLLITVSGVFNASQSGRGILAPSDEARGMMLIVALVLGFAVALLGYVLAIVVAALGQMLRATIDTAVHTSPLLTTGEAERLITKSRS